MKFRQFSRRKGGSPPPPALGSDPAPSGDPVPAPDNSFTVAGGGRLVVVQTGTAVATITVEIWQLSLGLDVWVLIGSKPIPPAVAVRFEPIDGDAEGGNKVYVRALDDVGVPDGEYTFSTKMDGSIGATDIFDVIAAGVDIKSWLGSVAPTVGQKDMASSLPVAIANNQSDLPVANLDVPLSTRNAETTQTSILARLTSILGQLDVALSTRNAETTQTTVLARLTSILAQLDVALSSRAAETTQTTVLARLTSILAQLDVALSSRAAETTQTTVLARLTTLLTQLPSTLAPNDSLRVAGSGTPDINGTPAIGVEGLGSSGEPLGGIISAQGTIDMVPFSSNLYVGGLPNTANNPAWTRTPVPGRTPNGTVTAAASAVLLNAPGVLLSLKIHYAGTGTNYLMIFDAAAPGDIAQARLVLGSGIPVSAMERDVFVEFVHEVELTFGAAYGISTNATTYTATAQDAVVAAQWRL